MGKLLNSELNAARLKDLVASFFSTRSLGISTGVCDLDQMHIATDPKLEQIFCSNSFLQTSNPVLTGNKLMKAKLNGRHS